MKRGLLVKTKKREGEFIQNKQYGQLEIIKKTPVEDYWGKLVNGTCTTGVVSWQCHHDCGLVWLTGDGAAGAVALQQHRESSEAPSKARPGTCSWLELPSSCWLVVNLLKQLLTVRMGAGVGWGAGKWAGFWYLSHWHGHPIRNIPN